MSSSLLPSTLALVALATLAAGACTATVRDFGEGGAATTGSLSGPTGTTAPSTGTQGPGSTATGTPTTSTTTTTSTTNTNTTTDGSTASGTVPQPQGAPCSGADGCQSGFCVDGVCCDAACPEACGACTAAKKGAGEDGVCGPIAAGTDPDSECVDTAPASCGTTGTCNGAFNCSMFVAGTTCGGSSCNQNQITLPDVCNGTGTCVDGGVTDCGNYRCLGDVCLGSCGTDADCFNGTSCRANGTCGPRDVLGVPCGGGADCQSGMCVDGVCCDSPCDGECMSCNWFNAGTCQLIEGGDPDNECPGSQVCCSGGFCSFPQQCLAIE